MELSEKEAHCVARMIQGALCYGHVMGACRFCKYHCADEGWRPFYAVRKRLTEETGVDVNSYVSACTPENEWPHLRLLKNANEDIKKKFREQIDDYAAALKAAAAE